MKNFKGLKRTLNKTMAMLTLCAVLISCVGVLSVSADIADGSKISTIDFVYGKLSGSGDKLLAKGEAAGAYNAEYVASNGTPAGSGDMIFGPEKEGSDNIVIKMGNGTTNTGTVSVRGLQTGFGAETKQKYEAKVKLASVNDWVDVLGYCTNNWSIFRYFSDQTTLSTGKTSAWVASPVRFKNNSIQILKNGIDDTVANWETVVTGLDTSKWYKVVRYMDFSVSEKNMNRVFIYTSDTTEDSSFELLYDSEQMYKCGDMPARNASQTVLCLGVEVREAASGQVMIDDLAAYNWEAAPAMQIVRGEYNVGSKNLTRSLNDMYEYWGKVDTVIPSNAELKLTPTSGSDSGFLAGTVGMATLTGDGTTGAVKFGDGVSEHRGSLNLRNLAGTLGNKRLFKWVVEVKLADASKDVVNVLSYNNNYALSADNYDAERIPVIIDKGTAYTYNGSSANKVVLCDGLESGKWYRIERYMDFSTDGVNKSRSLIFDAETDEKLGDTVGFLNCGNMTYVNASYTLRNFGVDVSAAGGSVMIRRLFTYDVESFDLPTENVSVDLGKLVASFDSAMKASSFDKTKVTLSANGKDVALKDVKYDAASNAVAIELNTLQYETDYIFTIAKDVMTADSTIGLTASADAVYTFKTEADPFSISELAFKDAAGADLASVTALNKGATVKGCATLANTSAKTRSYNLILAIYKGDEMTNLISKPGTIANTTEEGTPIETDALTIADDGSRAELFVWDSWEGLRPLTEKDVIPTPAA